MPINPEYQPSPNVYGIETEYSCTIGFANEIDPSLDDYFELVGACHSPVMSSRPALELAPGDNGAAQLTNRAITDALSEQKLCRTSNGYLSNGGRLYCDISGFEYCTPETRTAEEAVLRSFDGDIILLGLLDTLRKNELITGYQLNRRIVDHNRTSRGVHLNSLVDSGLNLEDESNDADALITLNIAKAAIFGSGGLLLNSEGKTEFHHSPKLSTTRETIGRSHIDNPIVRHPFKEDGQYARMETVSGDALNFGWPLRASMVLTNALVGLLEQRWPISFPIALNPKVAAAAAGQYGNRHLVNVFTDRDGILQIRPAEILLAMCEEILRLDAITSYLDQEALQVIPEIIEVADKIGIDEDLVATQVESIARERSINKLRTKTGAQLDSERICRRDYFWDMLQGGIAEKLRQDKDVGWQGFSSPNSPRDIKRRIVTPPQDTRAKIRGAYIYSSSGTQPVRWNALNDDGFDFLGDDEYDVLSPFAT